MTDPKLAAALDAVAAAIDALPYEHAMTIFMGATGSSNTHIAQVLQVPPAQIVDVRAQVSKAFVRQTRQRLYDAQAARAKPKEPA